MFDSQDVLKHSSLKCTLRGKCDETTTQFRNLKFANIPARFKDSILNNTLPIPAGSNGIFDATKFGPACPQKHGAQKLDLALLGSTRITLAYEHGQGKTEATNEFECLHLNVTVPNIVLEKGDMKPLPVLVWVHGGGFGIGSNSWPQYDLRRFVGRSAAIGKPVIGVSVNYRLGIFGVLASEELGAKGNMGYKDIVVALRWVKKHIAGFGGDPGDVTAAGNSAGAIALSTILCANVGDNSLFERVLLMSGQVTIRRPMTSYWHQGICEDQYRYLGLAKESESVKRSSLLCTDAQELAEKLPPIQHYCAHLDGQWLTEDLTTRVMVDGCRTEHKPAWCKEFVIGDTQHDGTIVKVKLLDRPDAFDRLKIACRKHLEPSDIDSLLDAYGLSRSSTTTDTRERMCVLFSEMRFFLPALTALEGWRSHSPQKRADRYHFHVPNPLEGRFKGLASHEVDVIYLLQNLREHFDEANRDIANQVTDHVVNFANGMGWAEQGKVIVFDQEGLKEVQEEDYDQIYRNGRAQLLENIGHAKIFDIAEAWIGVRDEPKERAKM